MLPLCIIYGQSYIWRDRNNDVDLAQYILLPYTLVFVALEFLLSRLYVGSFFAMLNAREPRPEGILPVSTTSIHLGTMDFRGTSTIRGSESGRIRTDSEATVAEKYTPLPRKTRRGR